MWIVLHIYQEGNKVADALASSAIEFSWWPSTSDFVQHLVIEDYVGAVNYRFVN